MRLYIALLCATISVPAVAQLPSGAQVLDRCQRAYDTVRTLQVQVHAKINGKTGTAAISFVRPGKLRASGMSLFGSKYDLLINGRDTSVYNGGHWSKVESPDMGIASVTGISANAATHIPSLLLRTGWGSFAAYRRVNLQVAREQLNGQNTYRLTATTPTGTTIWVDAKTYFLVRTSTKVMDTTILVDFGRHIVNAPIPASRFSK